MVQDEGSLSTCPGGTLRLLLLRCISSRNSLDQARHQGSLWSGGDITPPSARCSRSWEARLARRGAIGEAPTPAGELGASEFPSEKGRASLEGAELMGEPGGLHAVAAIVESSPTGVDLGLQFFEVVLQMAERGLLAAVSYHLGVCGPVG